MKKKEVKAQTDIVQIDAPEAAIVPQTDVDLLIERAIDKNVPVETMQKLLDMRRELRSEKAKEAYDVAMAKFQSECPVIKKDKKVYEKNSSSKVRYSYAPLDSIVQQVKECLTRNGFSYRIRVTQDNEMLGATCISTHSAGHSEETTFKVPIGLESYMSDVQKYGARLTFAKRYAFCNAFGILTGDEDTDASPETVEQKTITSTQVRAITDNQLKYICTLLSQKGKTKEDLYKTYKITTLNALTFNQASAIIERLNKMPFIEQKPQESPKTNENQHSEEEYVDPDEVIKGMEEEKKQTQEHNPPAANYEIAWVKARKAELVDLKIISESIDTPMFDMMTKKEYKRIREAYDKVTSNTAIKQ